MALEKVKDVYLQHEFGISHAGEAQNHSEAVELSYFAIDLGLAAFCPINLTLNARLCFISIYRRNIVLRSHFSNEVFDYAVFACESLILDLSIKAHGGKGCSFSRDNIYSLNGSSFPDFRGCSFLIGGVSEFIYFLIVLRS